MSMDDAHPSTQLHPTQPSLVSSYCPINEEGDEAPSRSRSRKWQGKVGGAGLKARKVYFLRPTQFWPSRRMTSPAGSNSTSHPFPSFHPLPQPAIPTIASTGNPPIHPSASHPYTFPPVPLTPYFF
ncbi:hypothetical protein E2C01_054397 [Portunus trituberculatus]|uniref:Uncharacterized protein n=1 Tax=Portunus trituberculatus TaxID=210409 RepID=A0A5B7GSL2_PORTR|nr:hypothetical protein [Portunus trituberculatus]